MIYTDTVMVNPSKVDKNIKSINRDGLSYFLPLNIQYCLNKEIQEIYATYGEENILSINITPITAEFKRDDLIIQLFVVRYIITYVYRG